MTTRQDLLDKLMERVGDQAIATLRDTLTEVMERELSRALNDSLKHQSFTRTVIDELRDGLGTIYREISQAKTGNGHPDGLSQTQTRELFNEASDQLDQILRTTEQATVSIMDIVEKHLDLQARVGELIQGLQTGDGEAGNLQELKAMHQSLTDDLMSIMTTLSFQDLTGQRIKRIIEALRKVESMVFDLYLTSGLTLKAHAAEPDKDIQQIKDESRRKVSELKGPQTNASSQQEVDDMLSQLGLD